MMKRHTVRYKQSLNCSENFLKVVLVTVCPLAKDNLVTGVPSLPFPLPLPLKRFSGWVHKRDSGKKVRFRQLGRHPHVSLILFQRLYRLRRL